MSKSSELRRIEGSFSEAELQLNTYMAKQNMAKELKKINDQYSDIDISQQKSFSVEDNQMPYQSLLKEEMK